MAARIFRSSSIFTDDEARAASAAARIAAFHSLFILQPEHTVCPTYRSKATGNMQCGNNQS
jgi:hypothetical protein